MHVSEEQNILKQLVLVCGNDGNTTNYYNLPILIFKERGGKGKEYIGQSYKRSNPTNKESISSVQSCHLSNLLCAKKCFL